MRTKKIIALVVCLMMLSSVALAATGDVYRLDGTLFATANEMNLSSAKQKQVNIQQSQFLYEGQNGKLYSMVDAFDAFDSADADWNEFLNNLETKTPVIIGEEELKVVSVSAINKDGVTVTFEALEEALEGVTVTVIDPEGNEVEVEAQDLEEGATSAVFAFVEALEKDPTTGVWTVNGVEYDFDERAAVKAVKDATNLVELWEALQSDYFTGAVEENIEAYRDAIVDIKNDAEKDLVTAEDVNKMIADVNASLVDAETIIQPILDAIEANNELQLLRALENGGFEDVESKLIKTYQNKLASISLETTVEEVQNTIYEVNATAAVDALFDGEGDTALAEKVDQAQIDAAKALVEKLPEEDQATLMGRVEKAQTLLDNAAAYAEAKKEVYALFKLDDKGELELENGKPVLKVGVTKEQITAADKTVKALKAGVDTGGRLANLITQANDQFAEIEKRLTITKVELIDGLYNSTKAGGNIYRLGYNVVTDVSGGGVYKIGEGANAKAATPEDTRSLVVEFLKDEEVIGKLEFRGVLGEGKYSGKSEVSGVLDLFGDYDSTSWEQTRIEDLTNIPDAVRATVEYNDGWVVSAVKDDFTIDEKPFLVEAINRAETADEMSRAIVNLEAAVNEEYNFTNLSRAGKLELAEIVIGIRDKEKGLEDIVNAASTAGKFFNAVNKKMLEASAVLSKVNAKGYADFIKGVNEASDSITTMRSALTSENFLPEFIKLDAAGQTEAATLVLEALEAFEEGEQFNTIAEIKAAAGL